MEQRLFTHIEMLFSRYPQLIDCQEDILKVYRILEEAYVQDRKLLVAGNGGSASDSEHIVGELMKEFKMKRKVYVDQAAFFSKIDPQMGKVLAENLQGALPAISLTGHSSLTTAYMNDSNPDLIFAQQINGYGKKGDVYFAISTSGNSKDILYAAVVAKAKGLKVVGLTGARASKLIEIADVCIRVPETETYKIQELHLPVYHCLCMMLEDRFFGE